MGMKDWSVLFDRDELITFARGAATQHYADAAGLHASAGADSPSRAATIMRANDLNDKARRFDLYARFLERAAPGTTFPMTVEDMRYWGM
jgi:hypothetical protein